MLALHPAGSASAVCALTGCYTCILLSLQLLNSILTTLHLALSKLQLLLCLLQCPAWAFQAAKLQTCCVCKSRLCIAQSLHKSCTTYHLLLTYILLDLILTTYSVLRTTYYLLLTDYVLFT